MPKIITTGQTITLADTDIASITFAYEDGELTMIVDYSVLRDDGMVHEVKRVGHWPGHQGLKALAAVAFPKVKDEVLELEELV